MNTLCPVALITGSAHRLGAATASRLHQRGWKVLIHHRSRPQQAADLAAKLNQARADSARVLQADLSVADEVTRLAADATSAWNRLDAVVNNASAFFPTATPKATPDDWSALMDTNLRAPFFLVQACLPTLQASRGNIVNLIDIYSERPLADHPLYCASKAGLAALTKSWARELAPHVRVNGVSPGAILWPEGDAPISPDYQQGILAKTPLARTGTPDDIAGAVTFLICDAPFITGQILAVDGGRSLNM
ncbi:pteridine reductase [Marinobacter zhejiangensis]|uniref:Pteridine reductase n=1 Tax=Marinobacter zhejiangensis TaxID=488535 RepID=A0A1I4TNT2_9GAMM|nr:pteridine reductase [Marinobacter zhejiangensis]SFM78434.1 pteridine reductase [Marinobacter zhejiangensis]